MSPRTITQIIEALVFVGTILLFVWLCIPSIGPHVVAWRRIKRVATRKRPFIYLACAASILFSNAILTHYDYVFTRSVVEERNEDYTGEFHRIEGDCIADIQGLKWKPITWFLSYAYIIVFPCLVIVMMLVLDHLVLHRSLLVLLVGYLLNYLFVLPFYIFFPVREIHAYSPKVFLLLDELHPTVMQLLRPMSGLDNCFPSFHTSLSVTLAFVAVRSGCRRLGWLTSFFSAAIVFSTLYLGIHWLLDVAAGVAVGVLAWVCAEWIGRWLSRKLKPVPAEGETG